MPTSYLVSNEDLVLSRLGSEYDPIIYSITAHGIADELSLKDIQAFLLNQECRLEQLNVAMELQNILGQRMVEMVIMEEEISILEEEDVVEFKILLDLLVLDVALEITDLFAKSVTNKVT